MSLAEESLQSLLVRGERARLRKSDRAIRISFRETDSPYWTLDFDQRDQFHAAMRQAESADAVALMWSRLGGDDRPLDFVVLKDVDLLARHIGASTRASDVLAARTMMQPMLGLPRAGEILALWEELKLVRGLGPSSAPDFVAAWRVVVATTESCAQDRVLRQLSAELFGDSKRIEGIRRHLDILTAERISSPARHWQEVFGALGLIKEPQPFLIAGKGEILLSSGQVCFAVEPFVGMSNQVIAGYRGSPRWLLSIENLTTFHQAAKALAGRSDGVILYTGGMPSPAWRTAYRAILQTLPVETRIYHWGDFDEGGFRIAAAISDVARAEGHSLNPWLMHPSDGRACSEAMHSSVANSMARSAEAAGWHHLAQQIAEERYLATYEQEALAVRLPSE